MDNTINKAWIKDDRQKFLESWGRGMRFFDFEEMERFYKEEDLSDFDDDVKKFLAFLAGDGFFQENKVSFKSWINSENFTNPIKDYKQDVTISQCLQKDFQ